jgi:branched-chain amino acid transport system permease protein
MDQFLQFSLNGIMIGAVYALIAVGIVSIYKSTKVVNFAHGHIVMFGAFIFYSFAVLLARASWMPDWYKSWEPGWTAGWAETAQPFSFDAALLSWIQASPRLVLSLIGTVVVNAVVGYLIERIMMRPLATKSPQSSLLVTIGLISVFNGMVVLLWTGAADYAPYLGPYGAIWFEIFGMRLFVMGSVLTNFVISGLIFAAILVLFFATRIGIAIRATAEDPASAAAIGINVPRIFSGTWMLACATGAVAGAILASNGVSPAIGFLGFSVLSIVIMGGLDSFAGCAVAALLIGWIEAMARWQIGDGTASIVPYVAVLLVLMVRPAGLFGTASVERI